MDEYQVYITTIYKVLYLSLVAVDNPVCRCPRTRPLKQPLGLYQIMDADKDLWISPKYVA